MKHLQVVFFVLLLIFISCEKKDDPVRQLRPEEIMLTKHRWQIKSTSTINLIDGHTNNEVFYYMECEKDNVFIFGVDGTWKFDPGVICRGFPDGLDYPSGTWKISDGKLFKIQRMNGIDYGVANPYSIIHLTDEKMVLSITDLNITYTSIYEPL